MLYHYIFGPKLAPCKALMITTLYICTMLYVNTEQVNPWIPLNRKYNDNNQTTQEFGLGLDTDLQHTSPLLPGGLEDSGRGHLKAPTLVMMEKTVGLAFFLT